MVVVVIVGHAEAPGFVDLDERNLAALHSIANDGHQSELHHGSVGVKEHGLREDDVQVVPVKGDAEVAVAGVGFQQSSDLVFLAFNHLDDLEVVLQGLSSHGVVVVNACSPSGEVGQMALAVANVHRCADVERIGVLNGADQLVDADGLNLLRILLAVGIGRGDGDFGFLVDLGVSEGRFEARDEVASTDHTDHG